MLSQILLDAPCNRGAFFGVASSADRELSQLQPGRCAVLPGVPRPSHLVHWWRQLEEVVRHDWWTNSGHQCVSIRNVYHHEMCDSPRQMFILRPQGLQDVCIVSERERSVPLSGEPPFVRVASNYSLSSQWCFGFFPILPFTNVYTGMSTELCYSRVFLYSNQTTLSFFFLSPFLSF